MPATSVFKTIAQDAHLSDGSLRGVVGPLVKIGVPPYTSATQGTATVAASALNSASLDNPDGSASIVGMVCPAAVPNDATLRTELFGRVVGVRWWRRPTTGLLPFDVVIDGVAYPVDTTVPLRDNQRITSGFQNDYEALTLVATGLADTVHTVEVHLTPDPLLTTQTSLFLYGFIVERGRGYADIPARPRIGPFSGSSTLTTSNVGIDSSTTRLYAGLSFHNTDASTRTVTVLGPGGGTYRVLTLAAGTSGQITFASPKNLNGWNWKADAGSVVTAWAEAL